MNWITKQLNGLLRPLNVRVSRASFIANLENEWGARGEQLEKLKQDVSRLEQENAKEKEKKLLNISQSRWRADEPDAGLTWGVPMTGDEFVRVLSGYFKFENSTIVEIGPGYGRILEALLAKSAPFRRYIGLEISAARVARLRNRFRDPRIEFRQADVLSKMLLNVQADLVFSSAVFEHLYPDFRAALENVAPYLRRGGLAVIDFIRDDNQVERAAAWFDNETYIRMYSSQELKTLFEAGGFSVMHASRISFGRDILDREISRTIVVAKKESEEMAEDATESSKRSDANPFDAIAYRVLPACDPHTLEPPSVPAFRTAFGGFWTDMDNADAVLAGKVVSGELSSEESSLVEAWRRDGFVILKNAIDHAAIDAALKDFEAAYNGVLKCKMSYWDDHGRHIEPAGHHLTRRKDAKLLDLHVISDAAQEIQFAAPIRRFLQILFERPALAFQSLGFYYGSQQSVHQDTAFVRVNSPMQFVASWIALEDIQEGSGELEYYVGSHALQPLLFGDRYIWVQPGDPETDLVSERLHAKAAEAHLKLERFLAKKGDVLIWSSTLMHGGSPVQSATQTRKSLVTHYCPADLQPMYAYKGARPKRASIAGQYIIAEHW